MKAFSGLTKSAENHTKVKLVYTTQEPRMGVSMFLSEYFDAQPPFIEEAYILVENNKVFPLLEVFLPHFEDLKSLQIVDRKAVLLGFTLLPGEENILAYFFGRTEKSSQKDSIGV